jgi:CheY-like chemotaxis protein
MNNGPRVLVVEDDVDLRELLRDSLEEAGYDVVPARTGREAINMLEAISIAKWSLDAVDLVLTDLHVPEVTGAELIRLLRTARWPVPVVMMTAYASAPVRESTRAMGVPLLEKPFTLEQMKTTVRSELLRIRP